MVTERTATIELKGFEKLGQFLGGAKQGFMTTAKGEQAEGGAMKTGGGTGAVISKALLGKEGFAGLQKQMGSMATRMIPLSGAVAKGGIIGGLGAGVGFLVGLISKAFASSGIFTGVAGSFFKIAGVMMDMMLMPMLPYMMKFLQFMLTTILPLFQEAGRAIAAMLGGDLGPWFKLLMKVWKMVLIDLPIAIVKGISRGLFNIIVNGVKAALPGGGGAKKGGYAESGGGGGGFMATMGAAMMTGGDPMAMSGLFAANLAGVSTEGNKVSSQMLAYNAKSQHEAAVKGEEFLKDAGVKGTGSFLPDTFNSVFGFFSDIGKVGGGIKDSIWAWISGVDWNPFDNIGSFISGAMTKIWGAIKGFITGSDADGKEVSPSIPGKVGDLKDKIGELFPALGDLLATIKKSISTKFTAIWGGISTFITVTIPDKIPKWEDIWSGLTSVGSLLTDAVASVGNKVSNIWGSWSSTTVSGDYGEPSVTLPPKGIAGIIPNLMKKLPSWGSIWGGVKEKGSSLKTFAVALASGWVENLWGSWSGKTGIAGLLPKLWDNIKDLGSDLMGGMGDLMSVNVGEMTGMMLANAEAKFGKIFKATGTLGKATGFDDDPTMGDVFQQGSMTYEANIFDIMKGFGNMVKEKFMAPIRWAKEKWDELKDLSWGDVKDWGLGKLSFLGDIGKNIANKIIDALNGAISFVIDKWNNMIVGEFMGFSLPNWVQSKLKIENDSFTIPNFAIGGRVPGGPGNRVPAILHGGEYVVPSHLVKDVAAGGGGGTVTSHNQSFNITINSSYAPGDILRSITQAGAIDETAYLNTVA